MRTDYGLASMVLGVAGKDGFSVTLTCHPEWSKLFSISFLQKDWKQKDELGDNVVVPLKAKAVHIQKKKIVEHT